MFVDRMPPGGWDGRAEVFSFERHGEWDFLSMGNLWEYMDGSKKSSALKAGMDMCDLIGKHMISQWM